MSALPVGSYSEYITEYSMSIPVCIHNMVEVSTVTDMALAAFQCR